MNRRQSGEDASGIKMRVNSALLRATPAERRPRVQSVAKATSILFAVAQSAHGLRAPEIVQLLGLPRQATYHLLHTLVTVGMLTKNSENCYLLGLRVGTLVEAFPRQLAPPERLLPYVRQVSNETGETAYAVGWVEGEIVNLAAVRGRNAIQAAEVAHGQYASAHARASGKLLLAMADETTRDRFFATHRLNRRTPKTISNLAELRKHLVKVRAQGYALDMEEYAEGVCCLAVPVNDGAVPYAVGLSAPAERFARSANQYLKIVHRIVGGNFKVVPVRFGT